MKRYLYGVCIALLAGQTLAAGASADTEKRITQIQQGLLPRVLVAGESPKVTSLADRMTELKVPGVSIAVIHEGRIEWARGFGVVSTGGKPVTENTLFQAASISKPVFALAVLHQVDAGKLKLDTNVNEYLKAWKLPDNEFTREQKVTLRRLLSHTAGTTVHGFPGYAAGGAVPTTVQVLDGTPPANTGPVRVDIVPGSAHRYSGGGYTLAQLVLSEVTGAPLPELLRNTVLRPLGMTLSTYEQPLPKSRAGEVALPHHGEGNPVPGGPHVYPEMAAAGLWTTPSDLARYGLGVRAALAGKSKVLSAVTARDMLTKGVGNHGIGPVVGGKTSRKYFEHGGANEGYRCFMVVYEDGEGAVVMTNSDNGGELAADVMRTLAHVYQWPDFGAPVRTLASVKPAALDRLIGVYEFGDRSTYVLRKEGAQVVGHVIGHGPLAMFPSSDTELFAREHDVVVSFPADADGAVNSIKHVIYGYERTGKRVDEARARQVIAQIEHGARRIKEQKVDARSESALRKLVADLVSGNPDYAAMTPPLAEVTRQQLQGVRPFLAGLGKLEALSFQKVADNGADEFHADFANGKVAMQIAFSADGRMEILNLWPR